MDRLLDAERRLLRMACPECGALALVALLGGCFAWKLARRRRYGPPPPRLGPASDSESAQWAEARPSLETRRVS